MKKVLEDTMTRVPSEHSTPAAKVQDCRVYFEKRAAQGQTSYDALIVAAANQIEVLVSCSVEGPYRLIQNRSRNSVVALKARQQQRSPKSYLVRFLGLFFDDLPACASGSLRFPF